ncbi:MAG: hypothetical protein E7657_04425 [Ruminococcaceae bacterium]|nr:hypothetical protein [Oscillospiraceae bacterium]
MKKRITRAFLLCICLSMIFSLSSCGRKPNLSQLEIKYKAGFQVDSTEPLSDAELEKTLTLNDKNLISSGNYKISYANRSATYSYDEWCTMGANDDIFYPGALLDLQEESIKPLNIGELTRAPITISTNLETVVEKSETGYSSEKKSLAQTIEVPALSKTRDAIKAIVNDNIPNLSTFPTNIAMSIHEIQSKDELGINLGLGLDMGNINFSEKFDFDAMNKQTNLVVVFKQIYYSVDCDFPGSEKAFFDGKPSAKRLEETFEGTVPAYIASVNYGRIVVMSIQTNYTKEEVINALSTGYNSTGFRFLTDLGFGDGVNLDFTIGGIAQDKDTKISYFEYGGSMNNSSLVAGMIEGENAAENFKKIFMGAHNPNAALPISYTIRHLDGSLARLEDAKDYTVKNVEYIPNKVMDWSALKEIFEGLDEGSSSDLTIDLSRMVEYSARKTEDGQNDDLYNANYTITLPRTIKTFTLIGPIDHSPEIVYKNLSICANNPVHIILQDIKFTGKSGNAAIYTPENKTMHGLTISCMGGVQVNGAAGMSALAVNGDVTLEALTDSIVAITGATFMGGGGDPGKTGGTAIDVKGTLTLRNNEYATIDIIGGNGGNGVDGAAVEGEGVSGNNGEHGGNGGAGIQAENLVINAKSAITVYGGNGGNGGNGSNGTQGKTGSTYGWNLPPISHKAESGGVGGDGGHGGNGGNGAKAIVCSTIVVDAAKDISFSSGNGGDAGKGGDGGQGGKGGYNEEPVGQGGNGGRGGAAGNGGKAGNGAIAVESTSPAVSSTSGSRGAIGLAGDPGLGGEGGVNSGGNKKGSSGAPGSPGTAGIGWN